MSIVGYGDSLSVRPGQTVRFMISCETPRYQAHIVRLIHGDPNPAGPGFKSAEVGSSLTGEYEGRVQKLRPGSYVRVPHGEALGRGGSFTITMWLRPTTPEKEMQALLAVSSAAGDGYALRLDGGRLELQVGRDALRLERPVAPYLWHFVAGVYDSDTGEVRLSLDPLSSTASWLSESASGRVTESSVWSAKADLLIAGEWVSEDGDEVVGRFYNGKIEAPSVFSRALSNKEIAALRGGDPERPDGLAAAWDFSADIPSRRVSDVSGHGLHGRTVQMPMRAATGHGWDGSEHDWRHAPEQYGAIHFHDDDLDDAGWEVSLEWTVPAEVTSGIYAVHLQTDGEEDYVPFVVRPRLGRPTAKIAYVLPTFTYLAYANYVAFRNARSEALATRRPGQRLALATTLQQEYVVENRLLSCYDLHGDGSGVCYSSRLRPVLESMRPKVIDDTWGVPHAFSADLYLVDWLEHYGYEFDVLTDEDLHREGLELVEPYDVVLTSTHCEYWSSAMIDAMLQYLNGGGRFMSLTGNNFYWVTQLDPEEGHTIEIRRLAPRFWDTEPGEGHLSTTGEPGGLWRNRNRSPQSWTGLGFTAETGGSASGRPFVRKPASFDPKAAFVFEGVGADELIGDFSHLLGYGAAGLEIDRCDHRLGTPPGTLLLASASGFSDDYRRVRDIELGDPVSPRSADDPLVRADMVLLEYPNAGTVFNPGSISWCGCLSYDNYDNSVSRITRNVLDAFARGRGAE